MWIKTNITTENVSNVRIPRARRACLMFNRYSLTVERNKIDYHTNYHYSYNVVFTLHELKQAIKISRDTFPCIDAVLYQSLNQLPDDSILLHLYIFNHI